MTTSELVATRFAELLEVTDVGDAVLTLGRPYDTLAMNLKRANRLDLLVRLRAWKKVDAERLRFARGLQWQEGRA